MLRTQKIKSKEAIATLKFGLGAYHWSYKEKKETDELLKEADKVFQNDNPAVPVSVGIEYYELLGDVANNKGAYEKAIEHYGKAVANAEKLPVEKRHRENYADDKIIIGELYDKILAPDEAVEKYQKILAKKTEVIQDDVEKEIELNFRIGALYFKRQEYEVAVSFLEKALKAINDSKKNEIRRPSIQAMLATIFTDQRKYQIGLEYNSNALSAWRDGLGEGDLERIYKAHINQGLILRNVPLGSKSSSWYKITVPETLINWEEALTQKGLKKISHLTNPIKTTDFNLALLSYKFAEDLIPQFPKNQHLILNIELHMAKGALFFEACDYKRAKYHYQTALDLMKTIYPDKHPLVAETSRMLGEIYLAEQLYSEALTFVDKALNATMEDGSEVKSSDLPNITKTQFPIELLHAISTKGVILYNQEGDKHSKENLTQVLHLYDLAIKLLNTLQKTYRNEGAKYRLASITHKFSQQAVKVCNSLFEVTKEEKYLNQAFQYSELSKSALLLESIRDLKARKITDVPQELLDKENKLKVDINYLKSEVFYELRQGPNKNLTRLVQLDTDIKTKEAEHETILKNIEKEHPKYYNLKYNYNQKDIADLQQALKPNEVFLQYVTTDTFIYVLAIQKDKITSQFTPLDAPLGKTVKELAGAVKNRNAEGYAKFAYPFYQITLKPLEEFIKGKNLILSLDAELNYIPFEILPTNEISTNIKGEQVYVKANYLVYTHSVCYSYSGTLFLHSQFKSSINPAQKIAAWAPSFETAQAGLEARGIDAELEILNGAKKEVLSIGDLFGGKTFVDNEATEFSFKENAANYTVLHVATHGLLMDDSPLFSSLIFSSKGDDDGFLHTYELYNLNLNADLAVLSACNSGMGEFAKGEGVISLARGFAYAGVPNIVMSTWPVSDECTNLIMGYFYNNLKTGMNKDEALRQAKISFLDKYKDQPKVLAPFFWGGFVLTGNTDPIPNLMSTEVNYWVYIAIGISILVIMLILFILQKKYKSTVAIFLLLFLYNNGFAQQADTSILTSVCIQNIYNLDHVYDANVLIEELDKDGKIIQSDSFLSDRYTLKKLLSRHTYKVHISKEGFYPVDTLVRLEIFSKSHKQRLGIYLRPLVCFYVRGKVANSVNSNKINAGTVTAKDLDTDEVMEVTIGKGFYEFCGKCGHRYQVTTTIDKYIKENQEITLKSDNCFTPFEQEVKLDLKVTESYGNLNVGDSLTIHEFRFEGKTTNLANEGKQEVEKLIKVLQLMPDLIVSIAIHTDPSKSHRYNRLLSEKRVEILRQKLLDAGINENRFELVAKGENEAVFPKSELNQRATLWIRAGVE